MGETLSPVPRDTYSRPYANQELVRPTSRKSAPSTAVAVWDCIAWKHFIWLQFVLLKGVEADGRMTMPSK